MAEEAILITGGAGYIASHTVLELLKAGGYTPVVVDNLHNSSMESIRRVEKITGKKVDCYAFDMLQRDKLREVFTKYKFHAVIHFAGLKAVGESVQMPLLYYRVNLDIALNLLEVMKEFGVKNLIFSSSATVYGTPKYLPIDEDHPVGSCSNPYGKTKYFIEEILRDSYKADPTQNIIILRYFNPVGADESGEIGEDPKGIPNNLMPYISQVVIGIRSEVSVYGDNYDTVDGTGVRDYIHVVDLARGHLASLLHLKGNVGLKVYNLGTGKGVSVFQLIHAMEKASGRKIPYKVVDRRAGDVAEVYGNPAKAENELKWKAEYGIDRCCEDTWRWQSKNPNGYGN